MIIQAEKNKTWRNDHDQTPFYNAVCPGPDHGWEHPRPAAEADTSESARYYPISVEEYTYEEQNEPRINKVYQLSLSDNPSGIPTKDFVRNGRLYYLLDMTRKDEVGGGHQAPY